ncbi:MAG: hypothetical protein HYR60_08040, partial [Acidobacteria bacterium]|nr:hypothetical protein [Acidobacteriota bacterium]
MTRGARLYATAVIAAGSLVVAASVFGWPSSDGRFSVAYLLLVVLASMAKLKLPGIVGTYSLNAPLLVFGVVYLTLPETLAAGCAGALTQSLWRAKRRPSAVQVLFNAANLAISIGLCALANRYLLGREAGVSQPVALALAAGLYFLTNTYLTSEVLALVESKSLRDVWRQWYLWSAPYFLVGTAVVGVTPFGGRSPEPASWVILVALLYLVHFFYSLSVKPPGSAPASENTASGIPNRARMYIQAVVFAGLLMVAFGIAQGEWPQPVRFAAYLAVATLASLCKVRLPRMTGTISLNFVLLIVAVVELPFSEVVLISAVAGVAQSVWKTRKRPRPVQVVFNAACLVVSASLAWAACRWLAAAGSAEPGLLL